MRPRERNLGMVFQHYALFPHLTAAENVAFGLRCRKVGRAEIARRVRQALDMVGLGALGERRSKQLSGGQQQRVALARALVIEPDALLLDEPLGALDRKLRIEMQTELRTLQQRLGVTAVFVTHDQEEAMAMADRIAIMRDGMIEQIGTPQDIFTAPRTEWVAEFVGSGNIIRGDVRRGADGLRLAGAPGVELALAPSDDGPPPERSAIFVRAERLRLARADDDAAGFPYVVSHRYLGVHVEVHAAHADQTFRSLVSPKGAEALPVGAPVLVSADPTDCRLIETQGSSVRPHSSSRLTMEKTT